MKIVLENERPWSWNKHWSGQHWSKRSAEKERVRWLVLGELDPDAKLFANPVEITFTVYFKGRMQDCSNICVKPYEDALIGRVLQDDSPKYVRSVTTISLKDNKRPRIEIELIASQPVIVEGNKK